MKKIFRAIRIMFLSLVLAGLCAEGCTTISGTEFLDRGYDHIERALGSLNADIKREGDYGCYKT